MTFRLLSAMPKCVKGGIMKLLITFLAGLTVAILLGSADQEDSWSDHLQQGRERIGVYTSTFSGITSDGVCYLAVTNTGNGQAEVI